MEGAVQCPLTGCGSYGASISAICSALSFTSSARTAVSRCSIFDAPTIGATTPGRESSQARATSAGGEPTSLETFATAASTASSLLQSYSSTAYVSLSALSVPLLGVEPARASLPRASGDQGMQPTPSCT